MLADLTRCSDAGTTAPLASTRPTHSTPCIEMRPRQSTRCAGAARGDGSAGCGSVGVRRPGPGTATPPSGAPPLSAGLRKHAWTVAVDLPAAVRTDASAGRAPVGALHQGTATPRAGAAPPSAHDYGGMHRQPTPICRQQCHRRQRRLRPGRRHGNGQSAAASRPRPWYAPPGPRPTQTIT